MLKKIITIEGMHCSHCASTVERVISELQSVTNAKVNLDKNICTVKLTESLQDRIFIDAIKGAGFEVKNIETKKSLF